MKLRSISLDDDGIMRKVFRSRTQDSSVTQMAMVFSSRLVYAWFKRIQIHAYGATVSVSQSKNLFNNSRTRTGT